MKLKKRKKGFSLVELILVLAIVASLATAAYFVFNKVRTQLIANEVATVISTVIANYQDLLKSSTSNVNMTQDIADYITKDLAKSQSELGGMVYTMKNGAFFGFDTGTGHNGVLRTVLYFKNADICEKVSTLLLAKGYAIRAGSGSSFLGNEDSLATSILTKNSIKVNTNYTTKTIIEACDASSSGAGGFYQGLNSIDIRAPIK